MGGNIFTKIVGKNSYTKCKKKSINKIMKIKTAVSLPQSVFTQTEGIAKEMKISRSTLVTRALQEFIHRYQNQQLLSALNTAYEEPLDESESMLMTQMQKSHRQIIEQEW
jgi:metal-responsive CopG/Arc/MetJ family transcriptional regulator